MFSYHLFLECRNVFALITKKLDEKEKLYAFSIVDQTTDKEDVLTCISKAICTTMCRTDYVRVPQNSF